MVDKRWSKFCRFMSDVLNGKYQLKVLPRMQELSSGSNGLIAWFFCFADLSSCVKSFTGLYVTGFKAELSFFGLQSHKVYFWTLAHFFRGFF